LQLQTSREPPPQAYVLDYLMLAVMLLDQFSAPGNLQGRFLLHLSRQIDHTRLKLLLKIQRTNFQVFDVEEHRETSAAMLSKQARGARQGA